jgi:deazaflavin-dependent oxidoreductase (nitroreductase family)
VGGPLTHPGDLDFGYLTTRGRNTGRPHEIEIWFAFHGDVAYVLSGDADRSDWVRNLQRDPAVTFRVGAERRATSARIVTDPHEDALARRLLVEKYQPRDRDDLTEWGRTSLPVAIAWGSASDS